MIPLLYAVFIISGAAGLIYESIWTRYLGLFVGHDAYAQIVVLVIFLGGMALGAMGVSRWSERMAQPLQGYVAIEFVVGCIGLVFHDVFQGTTALAYDRLFPALAGSGAITVVKWGIASLLILPQSVLLGATFPLMSAGVLRLAPSRPGRTLALLYFANSLGAAGGVLISGFYLVPLAGLPGTLTMAAMLNLLVAAVTIGVIVAARSAAPEPGQPAAEQRAAPAPRPAEEISRLPAPRLRALLLAVSCGTAIASFIYEIDWIRMLSLVLGSATHSFELMLSAFILGLALGAFWIRSRADQLRDPVRTLGLVQWAMGALALATLPLYAASFSWMASLIHTFARTDLGYDGFTLARYGICLVIMLPATFCAGMTLPLITRTVLVTGGGERAIGTVYGWNTLGSIIGVAIGGLLLLPLIGLKAMLVVGAVTDMAIGIAILVLAAPARPATRRLALAAGGATLALAVGIALTVPLDRELLISGVYRSGQVTKASDYGVRFFRDGRTATVAGFETRETGRLSISTNGKPDASLERAWFQRCDSTPDLAALTGDQVTQTLLPMITLAHAPRASAAAVIGHGSGMSSHFLLGSPDVREVVTVEIEPEMIEGSRIFYPANRRVFEDPRSRLVIDDAKAHFAADHRRYDLILSEPSNPWVSGVSGLFTTEFYGRIRQYLTEDGVFGQWLHIYELDDGLVLSVLAALNQNFRSYEIYLVDQGDLLVVASNRPSLPRPDWSVFRHPAVARDLCRFRPLDAEQLDAMWLIGRRELAPVLDAFGQPNSDFYPVLDLGAERRRFRGDFAEGFAALSADWHNLVASVSARRRGPASDYTPATPDIPRVRARAVSGLLRSPRSTPTDQSWATSTADLRYRVQLWREAMNTSARPLHWPSWVGQMVYMESQQQGGMAGVADSGFYGSIERFMARHDAPPEARDVVAFHRGLAGWDFAKAGAAADRLLPGVLAKERWIAPDALRDGAVMAKLHLRDVAGARAAFEALAPLSTRKPGDLRTRLLESYMDVADGGKPTASK